MEYRASAEQLRKRIDELHQHKEGVLEKQREERLVLLQAEYYHLLRLAAYLDGYYDEEAIPSLTETFSPPERETAPSFPEGKGGKSA